MSGFSDPCQQCRERFQQAYDAYVEARTLLDRHITTEEQARGHREEQEKLLQEARETSEATQETWDLFALSLAENPGFGLEDMQAGLLPAHKLTPENALVIGPVHIRVGGLHMLWGLAPSREVLKAWSDAAYEASRESEQHKRKWEEQQKILGPLKNQWEDARSEEEHAHRKVRLASKAKQEAMQNLEEALGQLRLACQGQLSLSPFRNDLQLAVTPGLLPETEAHLRLLLKHHPPEAKSKGKTQSYALREAGLQPADEGLFLVDKGQKKWQQVIQQSPLDPELEELYADLPPLNTGFRIRWWMWVLLAVIAGGIAAWIGLC